MLFDSSHPKTSWLHWIHHFCPPKVICCHPFSSVHPSVSCIDPSSSGPSMVSVHYSHWTNDVYTNLPLHRGVKVVLHCKCQHWTSPILPIYVHDDRQVYVQVYQSCNSALRVFNATSWSLIAMNMPWWCSGGDVKYLPSILVWSIGWSTSLAHWNSQMTRPVSNFVSWFS